MLLSIGASIIANSAPRLKLELVNGGYSQKYDVKGEFFSKSVYQPAKS
jgi:hypothetical protein